MNDNQTLSDPISLTFGVSITEGGGAHITKTDYALAA